MRSRNPMVDSWMLFQKRPEPRSREWQLGQSLLGIGQGGYASDFFRIGKRLLQGFAQPRLVLDERDTDGRRQWRLSRRRHKASGGWDGGKRDRQADNRATA